MTMAEIKVKKWGNSMGLVIPKDIVDIENISDGDVIKIDIIKNNDFDGFGMFKGVGSFKRDRFDDHKEF